MTGKQLRDFRKGVELTQAQLAELLGVAGNTLARWERGEMTPPGRLLRLALKGLKRINPGIFGKGGQA